MMWTLVDDFGLFILTENRWHFNTNIILKTQAKAIHLRNITLKLGDIGLKFKPILLFFKSIDVNYMMVIRQ